MKKLMIASLVLISSYSSFAKDCGEMTSTYDIKICLSKELDKEDAELNKQYGLCMKKLDSVAQAKLRKAQKAWIAFRDSSCEFHADEMRSGTYEPVIAMSCIISETKERTEELKDCVEFR